jgi:predicted PurR-regulated permease PerM
MSDGHGMERTIAGILLALLAIGCVAVLAPFLSALAWAAILSSSTWPLFSRLEHLLGGRRSAAAAAMVACAAALLLLPLVALLSRMAAEVTQAAAAASAWMAAAPLGPPPWLATLPVVGPRLAAYWQDVAHDGARLAADLRAYVVPAREWLLATVLRLASGLGELILALLVSFFFYRDGMAGMGALRSLLVRVGGPGTDRLLTLAGATVRSVVYGVLGTNLAQATLAALGLHIAGVPAALFLSCALFFLSLIPLAPLVVFLPAVIWLAQRGAVASAIFLASWYVVVFILLEAGLRSYLISRGGELPLMLVFLGIFGGIMVFGLLGIFLGPTLLALGYALLRDWNAAESGLVHDNDARRQVADNIGAP